MKKIIALLAIVSFLIIPSAPYKVNASVCNFVPGTGMEGEALDRCLAEQRRQDQIARDQAVADAETNTLNNSSSKIGGIADQLQMAQNSSKVQRLKSQYGVSAYYNCYPCAYKDTSFPSVEASCLIQTEYCLERQAMFAPVFAPPIVAPVVPVKTSDQICSDAYGENSKWDGTKNDKGGLNCTCKTGYVWNEQRTNCIIVPVVPVKTNDQICNDTYPNSKGILNDKGSLTCDCKIGFLWNEQRTSCIVAPLIPVNCGSGYKWNEQGTGCIVVPIVPVKTNDQICNDAYPNSKGISLDDKGSLTCDCKNGYTWNSPRTGCVVIPPNPIPTPTLKPKTTLAPKIITKEVKSTPIVTVDKKEKVINPNSDTTSQLGKEIISENVVKPEVLQKEESEVSIKIEAPKTQEETKQIKEGLFIKVNNFFKSMGLKIKEWFN